MSPAQPLATPQSPWPQERCWCTPLARRDDEGGNRFGQIHPLCIIPALVVGSEGNGELSATGAQVALRTSPWVPLQALHAHYSDVWGAKDTAAKRFVEAHEGARAARSSFQKVVPRGVR